MFGDCHDDGFLYTSLSHIRIECMSKIVEDETVFDVLSPGNPRSFLPRRHNSETIRVSPS